MPLDKRRRAMFARIKQHFQNHPIQAGVAAGVGTLALAMPAAVLAGRQVLRSNSARESTVPIAKAARKLYPFLKKIRVKAATPDSQIYNKMESNAAFINIDPLKRGVDRVAKLFTKHGSQTGEDLKKGFEAGIKKAVGSTHSHIAFGQRKRDYMFFTPRFSKTGRGKRKPVLQTERWGSPEVLAHEFGHAVSSKKYPRKVLVDFASRAMSNSPVPISGITPATVVSLASQPLISRVKNEKTRKRLRIASAMLPAVAAAPMLAEEALATGIGYKIIKASGISHPVRRVTHTLVPAFSTYVGATSPGIVAGAVAGRQYLKKDKLMKQKKRSKT